MTKQNKPNALVAKSASSSSDSISDNSDTLAAQLQADASALTAQSNDNPVAWIGYEAVGALSFSFQIVSNITNETKLTLEDMERMRLILLLMRTCGRLERVSVANHDRLNHLIGEIMTTDRMIAQANPPATPPSPQDSNAGSGGGPA